MTAGVTVCFASVGVAALVVDPVVTVGRLRLAAYTVCCRRDGSNF
jgi:hypothetical protein